MKEDGTTSTIKIQDEIVNSLSVYTNLNQDIIITNSDKLEICLI